MNRLSVGIHGFRVVTESFDALGDLYKCAEAGYAQNFSVPHIANVMLLEESFPNVGLQLLDSQGQAPLVGFDRQHDGLYAITFLQHL